jgi:spore coat protein U-like protein
MSIRSLSSVLVFALLSGGTIAPLAAVGATANGTLTVTASVAKDCTLSSATLAFGSYDPVVANRTANLDQTGTITVTCTKNSSGVTLGFGPSANAPAACTTPARCMASGSDFLQYQIYSDTARTAAWTTPITETVTGGTTTPTQVTIYGRIPAAQDAAVGTAYIDTVVATVNF